MGWAVAIILASSAATLNGGEISQGWKPVGLFNALTADSIYNIENSASFPDQKIVNAQVILNGVGIEFHSFVRNCTPEFYDYRQDFVIKHDQDLDRQVIKMEKLASLVMDELQTRCGLPVGTSSSFMSNFEVAFRKAWALNKSSVVR